MKYKAEGGVTFITANSKILNLKYFSLMQKIIFVVHTAIFKKSNIFFETNNAGLPYCYPSSNFKKNQILKNILQRIFNQDNAFFKLN